MASKKFQIDRKALIAATQNVLGSTPKLIPEKGGEKAPSGVVPKEGTGKRKQAEVVLPSLKRSKQTAPKDGSGRAEQKGSTTAPKESGVAAKGPSKPFPAGPMDKMVMGSSPITERSSSSGASMQSNPPLAMVPSNYANPQGLQGECCITFKTHLGWFTEEYGARGYPTDCFKAFNLPQDLKHFKNRPIAFIADEFIAAQGVVNSLGVRLVKMAKN